MKISDIALLIITAIVAVIIIWNGVFIYKSIKEKQDEQAN